MRPLRHVEIDLKECDAKLKANMAFISKCLDNKPTSKASLVRFRQAKKEVEALTEWHNKLTNEWLTVKG